LDERGWHAFDLDGIRGELFVRSLQERKVSREQEMLLQFAGGAASNRAKRVSSVSPLRQQPSAKFAQIDALARRIWLVRP
jgi:hypothetical protein